MNLINLHSFYLIIVYWKFEDLTIFYDYPFNSNYKKYLTIDLYRIDSAFLNIDMYAFKNFIKNFNFEILHIKLY